MEKRSQLRLHTREQADQMEKRVELLRVELDKLEATDIRSIIGFQVAVRWVTLGRLVAWSVGACLVGMLVAGGQWLIALATLLGLPFAMVLFGRLAGLVAYGSAVRRLSARQHSELREAVVTFAYFGTPSLWRLRQALMTVPDEVSCASMGRHLPQCRHTAVV